MKINKLLELHFSETSGLEKSLGDSYLLKKNRIFKNIRTAALNACFSYTSKNNEDYLALSLSQLENILATKTIPYFDNITALTNLEKQHPQVASWNDIYENLRRNFHFHESCHAVARTLQTNEFKNLNDEILLRLIEESYANTCEMLAIIDCDKTAECIFFEVNSYTALFELKDLVQYLANSLGLEKLFTLVLMTYLHSNHLHNSLKDSLFKEIVQASGANDIIDREPKIQKNLKDLLKYCFYLDENFRQVATSFYLRLSTKNQTQINLKEKKYFSEFTKNNEYLKFVKKLSQIATQD